MFIMIYNDKRLFSSEDGEKNDRLYPGKEEDTEWWFGH